jgi:exopolysaccharide biosynthesis WecB/TagA/CpsF family protein
VVNANHVGPGHLELDLGSVREYRNLGIRPSRRHRRAGFVGQEGERDAENIHILRPKQLRSGLEFVAGSPEASANDLLAQQLAGEGAQAHDVRYCPGVPALAQHTYGDNVAKSAALLTRPAHRVDHAAQELRPGLMLQACALAEKNKWGIYLYGTNIDTLTKWKNKLLSLYPKLNITKLEPSKYRDLTKEELIDLQNNIEKSITQVIYIAIGSPKQEILTEQLANSDKGLHKVIVPVGASFDFISGVKKQAPRWIGELGFEWFYRLLSEPSRLIKRYVYSFWFVEEVLVRICINNCFNNRIIRHFRSKTIIKK